jgi:hypothetical protein
MPCGGCDDGGRYERELQNMLCELLTKVEREGCYERLVNTGSALDAFWTTHKLRDSERRAREVAQSRAEEVRRKALQKLTSEEVDALGYRR